MKYFVYCLYQEDVIIYIGSSTKLLNRLRTHKKDKDFDKVVYCELTDRQTMLDFEIYSINVVKPKLNRMLPAPTMLIKPMGLKWKRADLSFLSANLTTFSDDVCGVQLGEYYEYICNQLNIPISLLFVSDLTYARYDGKVIALLDGSGYSILELAELESGISFEEYTRNNFTQSSGISRERYELSLKQFD